MPIVAKAECQLLLKDLVPCRSIHTYRTLHIKFSVSTNPRLENFQWQVETCRFGNKKLEHTGHVSRLATRSTQTCESCLPRTACMCVCGQINISSGIWILVLSGCQQFSSPHRILPLFRFHSCSYVGGIHNWEVRVVFRIKIWQFNMHEHLAG